MTDEEVVLDAFQRFEAIGLRPLVGGSYASSAWGNPRQTHDLDITLKLYRETLEPFIESFEGDYMVSRDEIETALKEPKWPAGFQLLHFDSAFKIDVFLSQEDEYGLLVETRAKQVELAPGLSAAYVTAEDIVLMKLRWYELGNRVSDRQWNDLVQVIEIQGDSFDRVYLLKWADHFDLRTLAEDALSEARP